MPVSFKDKNGKRHVFANHKAFVTWLKANRPDIENPDAFAARIERNQSKTFSVGERVSRIHSKNLISGELLFSKEDKLIIQTVDIFLKGIDVPIITLQVDKAEDSAKFNYLIDTRASAGEYSVVWNIMANGTPTKIIDKFFIAHDDIDRTLPLELQHLR